MLRACIYLANAHVVQLARRRQLETTRRTTKTNGQYTCFDHQIVILERRFTPSGYVTSHNCFGAACRTLDNLRKAVRLDVLPTLFRTVFQPKLLFIGTEFPKCCGCFFHFLNSGQPRLLGIVPDDLLCKLAVLRADEILQCAPEKRQNYRKNGVSLR